MLYDKEFFVCPEDPWTDTRDKFYYEHEEAWKNLDDCFVIYTNEIGIRFAAKMCDDLWVNWIMKEILVYKIIKYKEEIDPISFVKYCEEEKFYDFYKIREIYKYSELDKKILFVRIKDAKFWFIYDESLLKSLNYKDLDYENLVFKYEEEKEQKKKKPEPKDEFYVLNVYSDGSLRKKE